MSVRQLLQRQLRAARLALGFLTTLPLPGLSEWQEGEFARARAFYPLAGYVVGGVVALVLGLPLPAPVRAALAVMAWLSITGMLHFDGLVDSADALLVMKSPAERLNILKDVHVGAFGLAAGGGYLLLLWSLLATGLPAFAPLVAAVAARTLLLGPMWFYPSARQESLGALARGAKQTPEWPLWLGAALLALPTLLLAHAWVAWLLAGAGIWLASAWAARRLGGGLTGDLYGLLIVVAEVLALLAFAWGQSL